MRPLIMVCEGCGARIRTSRPEQARTRDCPRCSSPLASAWIEGSESSTDAQIQSPPDPIATIASKPEPEPQNDRESVLGPELAQWYREGQRRHLVRDTLAPLMLLALLLATGYYWFQASGLWNGPPRLAQTTNAPEPAVASPGSETPDPQRWVHRTARTAPLVVPEFQDEIEAEPPLEAPQTPLAASELDAVQMPISTSTEQAIRTSLESNPEPTPLPDVVSVLKPPSTTAHEPTPTPDDTPTPAQTAPSLEPIVSPPTFSKPEPRRILVSDPQSGRSLVSRIYAEREGRIVVQLPDGSLGWPSARVETEQPFHPWSKDRMREALSKGPYRDLHVVESDNYLVFYNCSESFAKASATLLEALYHNLGSSLRARGLEVRDLEFPLVAVIFRNEAEFRAHRPVESDVQAYYEIYSNHIFLYESSERDQMAPELAALKKPQTIVHEGTHQILQNIGIQPRLAAWPAWLVEGLAEYCAPAANRRDGLAERFGQVNPFHMATLIDLRNPRALLAHIQGTEAPMNRIGRDPRIPWIEYLVTRPELSPTDYALAWALTHYLATHRFEEFIAYLEQMSKLAPLEPRTSSEHLDDFRSAFGEDLNLLARRITRHLDNLKYERIPYYAVVFEQEMGFGLSRRGALVSQSPTMIRQWLNTLTSNEGGPFEWQAYPYPSQSQARQAVQAWIERR